MSQYSYRGNSTMADSLLLYDVLDRIGLRTEVRRMYTRVNLTREQRSIFEKENLGIGLQMQTLIFGSTVEGTTTKDLNSDADFVYLFSQCIVAKSQDHVTRVHLECVISDQTKSGYVKLKLANGASLSDIQAPVSCMQPVLHDFKTEIDFNGDTFVSNVYKSTTYTTSIAECSYSKSGPAETTKVQPTSSKTTHQEAIEFDHIKCFKVKTWPRCAKEWIARKRHWPDKVTIDRLTGLGHLVVPKGHPYSPEQSLEWRISFSFQERHLMLSLNDVQYKCYVLMKLIKKSIIQPICGKCFTSYHCKTGLLYTIESGDTSIWTPDNLLHCLCLCLDRLYVWIMNSFIPNYFIPADNLMDGKVENDDKILLLGVLGDILRDPVTAIKQIDCDHVGKLFSPSSKDEYQVLITEADNNIVKFMRYMDQARIEALLFSKVRILAFITASPQDAMFSIVLNNQLLMSLFCGDIKHSYSFQYLITVLQNPRLPISQIDITIHLHHLILIHLKMYTKVTYLSSDDSEFVSLAPVATFICTSLASNLVVKAACLDDIIIRDWFLVASAIFFHIGMDSDALSSRLKFATALYYMGHVDSCIKVLDEAELMINDKQPGYICACRIYTVEFVVPESRLHTPVEDTMKDCVCTCVTFTRTEMSMVHPALVYEMYRSMGTPEDSRNPLRCKWFDCAVMDSKLYLLFMRYFTNHTKDTMVAYHEFYLLAAKGTCLEVFEYAYENFYLLKRYIEINAECPEVNEIIQLLEQIKSEPSMMSPQYDRVAHKETMFNVMGWLIEHMGDYELALSYYALSWNT